MNTSTTLTKEQIISSLSSLSIDDIRAINEAAYTISKSHRNHDIAIAKQRLYVGQKVKWSGRYGHNSGSIVKVNRSRCVIETSTRDCGGQAQRWTVPMTMLTAI